MIAFAHITQRWETVSDTKSSTVFYFLNVVNFYVLNFFSLVNSPSFLSHTIYDYTQMPCGTFIVVYGSTVLFINLVDFYFTLSCQQAQNRLLFTTNITI